MFFIIRNILVSISAIISFQFSASSQSDSLTCRDLKNGIFYSYPKNSSVIFSIERNGDIQKQIDINNNDTSMYKVAWESDCSYSLQFQSGTAREKVMQAYAKKHKRIILISGVTKDYYSYKIYEDKIDDPDVEEDTLWIKKKIVDDRVYNKKDLSEASFPGGDTAWRNYITKVITKHVKALTRANISGTCYLVFMIDKDGSISNIEPITMEGTLLAEVSIDAIKNGPKWIPASIKNKPLKARRIQPVTFMLQ